jgi:hypothetical protein
VIVDEFGGNVGIVTLQDVIAEMIGQLPDEFGLGAGSLSDSAMTSSWSTVASLFTRCASWRACSGRIRTSPRLVATSSVDSGIFRALASRCASTATSLRSSKPTIAGSNNYASSVLQERSRRLFVQRKVRFT